MHGEGHMKRNVIVLSVLFFIVGCNGLNADDTLDNYCRLFSGSWSREPSALDGVYELSWGPVLFSNSWYTMIDLVAEQPVFISGASVLGGQKSDEEIVINIVRIEVESLNTIRLYYEDEDFGYIHDFVLHYDADRDAIKTVEKDGRIIHDTYQYRVSNQLSEKSGMTTEEVLTKYGRLLSGSWSTKPEYATRKRNLSWGSVPYSYSEYILIDFLDESPVVIIGNTGGMKDSFDDVRAKVKRIEVDKQNEFHIYYEDDEKALSELAFIYNALEDTITLTKLFGIDINKRHICPRVRVSDNLQSERLEFSSLRLEEILSSPPLKIEILLTEGEYYRGFYTFFIDGSEESGMETEGSFSVLQKKILNENTLKILFEIKYPSSEKQLYSFEIHKEEVINGLTEAIRNGKKWAIIEVEVTQKN